jgi:addiction module HigA family antidote
MLKNHPHPGEILREDVLLPLEIDVTLAAKRLGIARSTLSRVLNGRSGISPTLAMRLEKAGVSTARFWMTLQANYELAQVDQLNKPLKVKPLHEAV